MTEIAISVKNVSKCYRAFDDQRSRLMHAVWPRHTKGMQEVWALKDINFEIKRGEAVAIIGRNGGGKSTLLEILTGTLTPTTGQVTVNGRVSALLELGSGFNPEYSGRDNVILNGLLLGLTKNDILSRFGEIEAFAEIGSAIDRPVKTYSSGMMMRLAFAVQVLCDPDILIIDEALSVGDFFFQQKCLSYIRGLCKKGVTLLFVSHDMGTVRDLCPRVIYLMKGSIQIDGVGFQAISHFFNEGVKTSESGKYSVVDTNCDIETNKVECVNGDAYERIKNDAIWRREGDSGVGQIVAIAIYDESQNTSTCFKIGDRMIIRVLFRPDSRFENHISVAICDKYGAIRSATGSLIMNVSGVNLPGLSIFELKVDLMIEASEYSLLVNLGYELERNRGAVLDEIGSLGPINVTWDYGKDMAPFLGQVGLPAQARFIDNISCSLK